MDKEQLAAHYKSRCELCIRLYRASGMALESHDRWSEYYKSYFWKLEDLRRGGLDEFINSRVRV